jgi:hypothetical protein
MDEWFFSLGSWQTVWHGLHATNDSFQIHVPPALGYDPHARSMPSSEDAVSPQGCARLAGTVVGLGGDNGYFQTNVPIRLADMLAKASARCLNLALGADGTITFGG